MPGNIGPLEIGIVLVLALLVFGSKRLPELGSGLGRGMREFKEGITGEKERDTPASALDAPAEPRSVTEPSEREAKSPVQ
jgi:sec-independent protein translocase protein TatA